MCRRVPKLRYFFLFTDILIYCVIANESEKSAKNTYIFHRNIDISQLKLEDIPEGEGMENAFQIRSNQKSFAVFAENATVKKEWMKDIQMAKRYMADPNSCKFFHNNNNWFIITGFIF